MQDEIDPEILAVRRVQASLAPGLDVTKVPVAEGRQLLDKLSIALNDGLPQLDRVEDYSVNGDGGPIRVRLYQPASPRTETILYIHGGGWFACSVDTHDRMMRVLAKETGMSVIGFDFRLSPEHAYPAALNDCRAVWTWLNQRGAALGISTDQLAIGGDSAGANLALALAIDQRDANGIKPVGLVLLYGCFAPNLMTESRARFGSGAFGLTGERLDWYWSNYLGSAADDPPILATPLHAPLEGLPPTYLGVAEMDVVSDESHLLAKRLTEAGVLVTLETWPRTTHGVLQMTRDVQAARNALKSISRAFLKFVE